MNKNDSERIAGLLGVLGFVTTEPAQADLICQYVFCATKCGGSGIRVCERIVEIEDAETRHDLGVTGCMPGRDRDGRFKTTFGSGCIFQQRRWDGARWIAERPSL